MPLLVFLERSELNFYLQYGFIFSVQISAFFQIAFSNGFFFISFFFFAYSRVGVLAEKRWEKGSI